MSPFNLVYLFICLFALSLSLGRVLSFLCPHDPICLPGYAMLHLISLQKCISRFLMHLTDFPLAESTQLSDWLPGLDFYSLVRVCV
jgi:hypothetical protein